MGLCFTLRPSSQRRKTERGGCTEGTERGSGYAEGREGERGRRRGAALRGLAAPVGAGEEEK